MKTPIQSLYDEVDGYLKAGEIRRAREILKRYRNLDIPVAELWKFASLARRSGSPSLAVRMLGPLVRPTGRIKAKASISDQAEYAASLLKLGAVFEAKKLLSELNGRELPEVFLFRALAHFALWDYEAAIPLLIEYIESPGLSDYQRAIGHANLVAALVDRRKANAESHLNQTSEEFKKKGYQLLLNHVLLNQIEYWVNLQNFDKAKKLIAHARTLSGEPHSTETLFLDKWNAVMSLREKGKLALPLLNEVRTKAIRLKHWETLRNCDYHQSVILKDLTLYQKVFYGTPFESLRVRLQQDMRIDTPRTEAYDWQLGMGNQRAKLLDLVETRGDIIGKDGIKGRSVIARCLWILTRDFYRPFRTAHLHSLLFPDDYYNPDSSPKRMHQVVKRLREALRKTPLTVERIGDSYRLNSKVKVLLRIPTELEEQSLAIYWFNRLKLFGERTFSAREASEQLKIGIWACRKILLTCKTEGYIEQVGNGPKACYRIRTPSSFKKSA